MVSKFQTQFPFHSKVFKNFSIPFPKSSESFGIPFPNSKPPNRPKVPCTWHTEENFGVSKLGIDVFSGTKLLVEVITSLFACWNFNKRVFRLQNQAFWQEFAIVWKFVLEPHFHSISAHFGSFPFQMENFWFGTPFSFPLELEMEWSFGMECACWLNLP